MLDEIYFYVRVGTFMINLVTFWILFYKYVLNNWTGRKHDLNWGAVGMLAGTFAYAYGTGEILLSGVPGGPRVFVFSAVGILWCWIAIYKIPIARELDEPWLKDY